MIIKSVQIEKFKKWDVIATDLQPLDCLVGSNNSGKTSLLQALALFDFCVHHCLSGKNGNIEIVRRSIAPEDFFVIPCANPIDLWTDRITFRQKKRQTIKIATVFDNDFEATVTIDLNYNKFGIALECSDKSFGALSRLRDTRISYLPVFSSFLTEEERKTSMVIEDALARGRANSVIRNLLLDLKKEERHDILLDILRRLFPNLENITISFDEINDRYITFNYREQGKPKEFDVFMAGSGFQQFVYLFGFITLRKPTVILLDEPDVHLHGTLQRGLLSELNRLVEQGKQIIFATHSRELIASVPPQNILSIEENQARRLNLAYDVYDLLDKLGSLDPTQLTTIQAYRRVLVVENQTDWELLSVFCEKLLTESEWLEVRKRVAVCYSHGNPYKQDIEKLRKQLQQTMALQGHALKLFVVADRDYHPEIKTLESSLSSPLIQWHIWERTEIENYLLGVDVIIRLINGQTEQITIEEALFQQKFDELLNLSRNTANDRLVKAFQELDRKKDVSTLSREAREYLEKNWETHKIALADAKETVLPGLKRWLSENGYGQFSDKSLASAFRPEDFPEEVRILAQNLAAFAGEVRSGRNGENSEK